MPNWYFDKKELLNTPSAADGIDTETELRYRKDGARFIQDTGTKMDLGCNTMATGVVYFHRFYMYHSFRQFPRYVTASCCLLLAGKVEETPKKCKDIIWAAKSYLSEQKFATFGDDPKEEVMTMERILLQTIKFDLLVEHPYHYLLKYAKCLKGDKQKLQKMVQMAWTFVNDSLCTTLCLQWEPEVIAVALMYLAGKLSKFEALDWTGRQPKHLRWWDMFIDDITMDLLEDICHQVLDLYSQPPTTDAPDSPPPSRHGPSQSLTPNQNRDGVKDSHSPKIAAPPVAVGAPIPNIVPRSGPKHPPPIVPTAIPPGSIMGANGDLTKITIDPTKPPPSLGVPIVDVLPPPGGPPPPGPFVQPPMGPPPQFIPTPVVPGAPPRIPPHPVVSHPPGPPPPVNIYTPPFPPPPNHVYHGPPPGAGYHGGPPYYPP